MAKKKQAENTPALNKDYPSKDIDLYDTFMSTIDDSVPRNIGETKVPYHVDKSPSVPGDDRKSPLDRGKDAF